MSLAAFVPLRWVFLPGLKAAGGGAAGEVSRVSAATSGSELQPPIGCAKRARDQNEQQFYPVAFYPIEVFA